MYSLIVSSETESLLFDVDDFWFGFIVREGFTLSSSGLFVLEGEFFAGILAWKIFLICSISLYSTESDKVWNNAMY